MVLTYDTNACLSSIIYQFDEKAILQVDRLRSWDYSSGMLNETDYRTPGQLIKDLLAANGWTQRVLAIVLNEDETGINKIIADKRPLDARLALILGELFNVPPERFLDLQKTFELAQARIAMRPDPGRTNRAHLFGKLPVTEMIKRGWIEADDVRNTSKVEAELVRFFGAESADEIEILPHAAKKTNVFGDVTPAQLAWLYRVRQMAEEMLVSRYSPSAVRDAIVRLKELLSDPEQARNAPRILAEAGIRFMIVESLAGTKIDGVCFWLNDFSPVIALTARYDRIDNFWFVLRHELEHVLRGHGRQAMMLDAELEGERAGTGATIPEEERIANQAAADFCVPSQSLEKFILRKAPFFSERDVLGFAATLKIHPGLVAGQLHNRTGRHNLFRKHLSKIRAVVAPSALVDGWGDVAPVGN